MGGGSWSQEAFHTYSKAEKLDTKSTVQIYDSHFMQKELDPKFIKLREARDSAEHPESTPIILGVDVTGSMDPVLGSLIKSGLNKLVTEIYDRAPVKDPQILCAGIGDVEFDKASLQATQFESDIRIAKQLKQVYFERGGGGNNHESYTLPWYFAAFHTATDAWDKRGKKGYIFTFGDEQPNMSLDADEIQKVFGYRPEGDLGSKELLKMVHEKWNVFHLMVAQGNYFQSNGKWVMKEWHKLLGKRAILLPVIEALPQVIVSTIQMVEGTSYKDVLDGWDKDTKTILESIPEFSRVVDLS